MATKRLYDENSHETHMTARVCDCQPHKNGFAVVLDQTVFYPEGGGQNCDTGTLGTATVLDVREQDGLLLHICDAPLPVGAEVEGVIDWARRFDLMQQHSGEHIVSGLVHRLYGYDNVGFHMGADRITIDFNGDLSDEQLVQIEALANDVVCQNVEILTHLPSGEALSGFDYRSKKELTGQVRLVEIPQVDLCACCGTHVKRTGEIGVIRLLACAKFRDGVRIDMLCGKRCLSYLRQVWEQNRQISNLLSAKPTETAAAVARQADTLAAAKARVAVLEDQIFAQKAQAAAGSGDVCLFEDGLSPDSLRRLTLAISAVCGGRAMVFSGCDDSGYQYAMGHEGGDLRAFSKGLNGALSGRGGGKPNFVQGSLQANRQEIETYLKEA